MTALEYLETELSELEITKDKRSLSLHLDLIDEAYYDSRAMLNSQIEKYVEFCILCQNQNLPLITFNDFVNKL